MNENQGYTDKNIGGLFFWIRESEFTKKSLNKLYGSIQTYTNEHELASEFQTDIMGTLSLKLGGTAALSKLIKLGSTLLETMVGAGVSVLTLDNLEFQERHVITVADVGNWYGKIKYNALTNKELSQEYYGFEKTGQIVLADRIERVMVHTPTGKIIGIFGTESYPNPIYKPTNLPTKIPLTNF